MDSASLGSIDVGMVALICLNLTFNSSTWHGMAYHKSHTYALNFVMVKCFPLLTSTRSAAIGMVWIHLWITQIGSLSVSQPKFRVWSTNIALQNNSHPTSQLVYTSNSWALDLLLVPLPIFQFSSNWNHPNASNNKFQGNTSRSDSRTTCWAQLWSI